MKPPCDCCAGPNALTPAPTANRPGLTKLKYRVGIHPTFFESMQARLSSPDFPELRGLKTREKSDPAIALLDAWATLGDVLTFYQERIANEGFLRTATERRSVLELARLIGYAPRPGVSASVYLAYSLEKDAAPVEIPAGARANSIPGPGEQMQTFETSEALSARYEWSAIKPRLTQPQTAASIAAYGLYLKGAATNLKANDPLLIDLADGKGLTLRRIEKVEADSANDRTRVVLRGRKVAQATVETVKAAVKWYSAVERFGLSAAEAKIKGLLAVLTKVEHVADEGLEALAGYMEREALPKLERELLAARKKGVTKLELWIAAVVDELEATAGTIAESARSEPLMAVKGSTDRVEIGMLGNVIETLKLSPSVPPASSKQLQRSAQGVFAARADTVPRLLASIQPTLQETFYPVLKNLPPPLALNVRVFALRVAAAPFGHNAPLRQSGFHSGKPTFEDWRIEDPWNEASNGEKGGGGQVRDHHLPNTLYFDNDYDIAPDSMVVIVTPRKSIVVSTGVRFQHGSLVAYGLSGKTVQAVLPAGTTWIIEPPDEPFSTVRSTRVLAGSEELKLAEEPVTAEVAGSEIELGDLYADLQPGRWLIVAGERSDIRDGNGNSVTGVKAAELVMLAGVEQRLRQEKVGPLAGETIHTFLKLAKDGLSYTYKRDTVTIYGNVIHATHGEARYGSVPHAANGETRPEVLGGGDAAKVFQQFTLKQPPLTHVSAPTDSGVQSTLEVRVDDVAWREAETLAALGSNDRKFTIRTDDDSKTTVVFGNGERGARLPTGQENVKAKYRSGIGRPGNVKAGQISLLTTRPLGVKEVVNPIRASGGADKEGRDQARKNAPLAVLALDRLVSTQDYADVSRLFGGVGKAAAVRLSDGRRELVHVTVAGADDAPIDTTSDVYRHLRDALHRYGDPCLPVGLATRHRLALVVSAKVRIAPERRWDLVEPKIRAAMLDAFGFENVELGEDLFLSDAISVMQKVPGVVFVDVDVFDSISETALLAAFSAPVAGTLELKYRIPIEAARPEEHEIAPAQLAYLSGDVPDTLLLQELKP